MGLSLLERISREKPTGSLARNRDLGLVRKWVKSHESEIAEAKERGYSWKQITAVCVEMWKSSGIFSDVYTHKEQDIIRECYYDVKNGLKSGKGKSPKPTRSFIVKATECAVD